MKRLGAGRDLMLIAAPLRDEQKKHLRDFIESL
jgi:hypothetical protein